MTMRERRHLLCLQRPVITIGELGDREVSWVDVTRVWARRTNRLRAAADAIAAGAVIHTRLVQFDIRSRPIDPTWRIVTLEDGQRMVYDIRSVAAGNGGREMAILAVTGASDG